MAESAVGIAVAERGLSVCDVSALSNPHQSFALTHCMMHTSLTLQLLPAIQSCMFMPLSLLLIQPPPKLCHRWAGLFWDSVNCLVERQSVVLLMLLCWGRSDMREKCTGEVCLANTDQKILEACPCMHGLVITGQALECS